MSETSAPKPPARDELTNVGPTLHELAAAWKRQAERVGEYRTALEDKAKLTLDDWWGTSGLAAIQVGHDLLQVVEALTLGLAWAWGDTERLANAADAANAKELSVLKNWQYLYDRSTQLLNAGTGGLLPGDMQNFNIQKAVMEASQNGFEEGLRVMAETMNRIKDHFDVVGTQARKLAEKLENGNVGSGGNLSPLASRQQRRIAAFAQTAEGKAFVQSHSDTFGVRGMVKGAIKADGLAEDTFQADSRPTTLKPEVGSDGPLASGGTPGATGTTPGTPGTGTPGTTPTTPTPPPVLEHTVVAGDNLWAIAEAHLRTVSPGASPEAVTAYWRKVVEVNQPTLQSGNPSLIFSGERIVLPAFDGAAPTVPATPAPPTTPTTPTPSASGSESTATPPAQTPTPPAKERQPGGVDTNVFTKPRISDPGDGFI